MWSAVYLTCGGVSFALFPLASLTFSQAFSLYIVAWQSKQRQQKTFSSLLSRSLSGQGLDVLSQYQQFSQSDFFQTWNFHLSCFIHPFLLVVHSKERQNERKERLKGNKHAKRNEWAKAMEEREETRWENEPLFRLIWAGHGHSIFLLVLFFSFSSLLRSCFHLPFLLPFSTHSLYILSSFDSLPCEFHCLLSQSRERCWDCWRESIKLQPNTGSTRTASIT